MIVVLKLQGRIDFPSLKFWITHTRWLNYFPGSLVRLADDVRPAGPIRPSSQGWIYKKKKPGAYVFVVLRRLCESCKMCVRRRRVETALMSTYK